MGGVCGGFNNGFTRGVNRRGVTGGGIMAIEVKHTRIVFAVHPVGQQKNSPGVWFARVQKRFGANHHQVGLAAELNMADLDLVLEIPQAGMDRVFAQRKTAAAGASHLWCG